MNFEQKIFQINECIIEPDRLRIINSNGEEIIGKQLMKLLVYLIQNQGQVVTREQLLNDIWDGIMVNEESVTKAISTLRAILDEDQKPSVIKTIRSIGYCLISPVEIKSQNKNFNSVKGRKSFFKLVMVSIFILSVSVASFVLILPSQNSTVASFKPATAISVLPGPERVPRISPDGKKVVFAWQGPENRNYDIYIQDLETANITALVHSPGIDTDPVWSPSGEKIAFYRNNGKNTCVLQVDVKSGVVRQLANANFIPNLSALAWSGDSVSIAFVNKTSNENPFAIYNVDYNTSEVNQITFPDPECIGDFSPRYSPDNKKLAFVRLYSYSELYGHIVPGKGYLMIKDLESNKVTKITNQETEITGVDWISNSEQLVYSVAHDYYTFHINLVGLENQESKIIHTSDQLIRNIGSNVSQGNFTFEAWQEEYSILSHDLNNKHKIPKKVIEKNDRQWYPRYSPDGTKLAYVTVNMGRGELWIYDLSKNKHTQVYIPQNGVIYKPEWSPDGSELTFSIEYGKKCDLFITQIQDLKAKRAWDSQHHNSLPKWSKDGKNFYFKSNRSGKNEIWSTPYPFMNENQEFTQITNSNGLIGEELGEFFYYSSLVKTGIWQLNQVTGIEEEIIPHLAFRDWAGWEIHDGSIYYIKRSQNQQASLNRYDIATQLDEQVQLLGFTGPSIYGGFSIHPDGSSAVFALMDNISSELMIMSTL